MGEGSKEEGEGKRSNIEEDEYVHNSRQSWKETLQYLRVSDLHVCSAMLPQVLPLKGTFFNHTSLFTNRIFPNVISQNI